MKLSEDIRDLILEFDGKQIIIKNNKESNDLKLVELEEKYERAIEILSELGKIDIDVIDDLSKTVRDLELLGIGTYIEGGYLKINIIE